MKDHEIARLVNELRDCALQYRDTQQLRSRIANIVLPALRANREPALTVLPVGADIELMITADGTCVQVRQNGVALWRCA